MEKDKDKLTGYKFIHKVFAVGSVLCFLLVLSLIVYPALTTPVAISATKAQNASPSATFDFKFLLNILVLIGSLLGFAFFIGGRLAKIEESIIHIKEENNNQKETCKQCLNEGKIARKEIWVEVNSTKDRVTVLETMTGMEKTI